MLPGTEQVEQVLVNGEASAFTVIKKEASAFPLKENGAAPDHDILILQTAGDVSAETRVEFVLA